MKRIADNVADWLVTNKITHAFGIIGAGNLALFDAISKKKEITLVCCHHEQAAAMASDYFNRTVGKLASVCLVTTGAGAANAITGVLAAWMDSTPLMVISGNEPSPFFEVSHPRVIGVQGYESHKLVKDITKYSCRVHDSASWSIEDTLDLMHMTAITRRKGPVWIDIPRDIQVMEAI